MNVYVRELTSALARSGVRCDVFTRRTSPSQPAIVQVEPGLAVHHVTAGPVAEVPLADLEAHVGAFADGVRQLMTDAFGFPLTEAEGGRFDAIHANYWLSALAGHTLKHQLHLPLISTFHTLDRVKAETDPTLGGATLTTRRSAAEAEVIGCSDAVLASCDVEAAQITELYGADPSRIVVIPPGIDHAVFGPGDQKMARRAIGFQPDALLGVFVGRIQPLKRADIAVATIAELVERGHDAHLVVVGGPSGPGGPAAFAALSKLMAARSVEDRVHLVDPQPHHLLSSYYRAADVVLVPSRSESFGLVALEAATCGIPVVASKVGGLTTIVDDMVTGRLIDAPDPLRYADAVEWICTAPGRWQAISDAAVHRAAPYTWKQAALALDQCVGALVASNLVQC